MSQVDALLEGPEQHWNQILLSKLVLFECLNELVVLEQRVHADKVVLFQVGVGDAVINEVLCDKGNHLDVEAVLGVPAWIRVLMPHFLVQESLIAFQRILIRLGNVDPRIGIRASRLSAERHARRDNQAGLTLEHAQNLERDSHEVVWQNVDKVRNRRINVVYELQEPQRKLHQHLAGVGILETEPPDAQLRPQNLADLVRDFRGLFDFAGIGEVHEPSMVHVHLV